MRNFTPFVSSCDLRAATLSVTGFCMGLSFLTSIDDARLPQARSFLRANGRKRVVRW